MKARRIITCVLPLIVVVAFLAMTASVALATGHLSVTSGGKTFPVPSSLASGSVVDTPGVQTWLGAVKGQVDCSMRNASFKVDKKKKKLVFTQPRIGYSLNVAQSLNPVCVALALETSTSPNSSLSLTPWTHHTNPKVSQFPKQQILVIQSQTKFYLYKYDKIIRTYRIAVGQPAWPTPNGTFHVGKKNPHPTWTNGGASWSRGMPSFIGPGPNNPLGTRAIYVYTGKGPTGGSDTGVRFHGVPPSESASIGHARSHGCLRMHRKDVEAFYPLVQLGTTVYIIK